MRLDKEFTGQSCANLLMAMVNYNVVYNDLKDELKIELRETVLLKTSSFNAQEIANALNALSKFDWKVDQALQEALLKAVKAQASSFDSQNISNTLNALSKFDWKVDQALQEALLNAVKAQAIDFKAQEIANTLNALSKLDWKVDQALQEALLKAVKAQASSFNAQGIANTLNALSKFDWKVDQALQEALLNAVKAQASSFDSQNISNTLNALSKFDWKVDQALQEALLNAVKAQAGKFNAQEIASTLNALSKFDWKVDQALQATLLKAVKAQASSFDSQGIANTLNALSKFDWKVDQNLQTTLLNAVKAQASRFNAQDISNTLNSLSKFDWKVDQALQEALLNAVKAQASRFNAQDIANTLNALSKFDWKVDQALQEALLNAVKAQAIDFKAQEIANTLNALSKLDWKVDQALQTALLNAVKAKAIDFNAQEIANTLNALSKLDWQVYIDQALQTALLSAVKAQASRFNAQDIANTLNALSKFDWKVDQALQEALLRAVKAQAGKFNAQNISNTLNALSKLEWEIDQALQTALLRAVKSQAVDFNAQGIANTLMALNNMDWFAWDNQTTELQHCLLQATHRNMDVFNRQDTAQVLRAFGELGVDWKIQDAHDDILPHRDKQLKLSQDLDLIELVKFGIDEKYIDDRITDSIKTGNTSFNMPPYDKTYDFQSLSEFSACTRKHTAQELRYDIGESQFFHYDYYTSNTGLPTKDDRVVFIYCGRKLDAKVPGINNENTRVVLVLTQQEYVDVKDKLPSFVDMLVIKSMNLASNNDYAEVIGTINARRLSTILFASHNNLEHCLCLDDNIQKIVFNKTSAEPSHKINFSEIYDILQNEQQSKSTKDGKNVLLGAATISGVMLDSYENRTFAKIFFIDLKSIFATLDQKDLRCLGYKAHDSKLWGEDVFFQLMLAQLFSQNKLPFEHIDPAVLGFTRSRQVTNLCKKNIKSVRDFQEDASYLVYSENDKYASSDVFGMCSKAAAKIKQTAKDSVKNYDDKFSKANLEALLKKHYRLNASNIIPLAKNVTELRNHQKVAIHEIASAEKRGVTRGIIVQATGAGKSITQMKLAINMLHSRNSALVVIVCPARDLVEQFYVEFAAMLQHSDLFKDTIKADRLIKISSGQNSISTPMLNTYLRDGAIEGVVAIICSDSFEALISDNNSALRNASLICMDECHHSSYSDVFFRKLDSFATANINAPHIYGFTATPRRENQFFISAGYKDGIIYRFDIYKALLSKVICPIKTEELSGYRYEQLNDNLQDVLNIAFKIKHPKYGDIRRSKTIIYLPSVNNHFDKVSHILSDNLNVGVKVFKIHSGPDSDKLSEFAECDTPCIALACGMLRLGYSDNKIGTIIYLRDISTDDNLRDLEQAAGRSLRVDPDDESKSALLISWDGVTSKAPQLNLLDHWNAGGFSKQAGSLDINKNDYTVSFSTLYVTFKNRAGTKIMPTQEMTTLFNLKREKTVDKYGSNDTHNKRHKL
jgi:hypothetical protein